MIQKMSPFHPSSQTPTHVHTHCSANTHTGLTLPTINTSITDFSEFTGPAAQWLPRATAKSKVPGSIPPPSTNFFNYY